jgi:hypothetical protein
MEELFSNNVILNDDVKRNIVSLRKSEDLFDDLYDAKQLPDGKAIAQKVEARVKQDIPNGLINRGFHYTTGILYPFQIENYQKTRFSDSSFGCWYGSLELDTTIYETAFHNLKNEMGTAGVNEIIYRERAIYNIFCQGILIDLRGKEQQYPQLIAQDYSFTHQIGGRLAKEGHPGLVAPSARYAKGSNVVAFSEKILSYPRLIHYLNYYINPMNSSVRVEKEQGKTYLEIDFKNALH